MCTTIPIPSKSLLYRCYQNPHAKLLVEICFADPYSVPSQTGFWKTSCKRAGVSCSRCEQAFMPDCKSRRLQILYWLAERVDINIIERGLVFKKQNPRILFFYFGFLNYFIQPQILFNQFHRLRIHIIKNNILNPFNLFQDPYSSDARACKWITYFYFSVRSEER